MCYRVLQCLTKITTGCISQSELRDVQICYRVVICATKSCCVLSGVSIRGGGVVVTLPLLINDMTEPFQSRQALDQYEENF